MIGLGGIGIGAATGIAATTRCVVFGGLALLAAAAPAQSPSRGELLYTTHCVACHSTQVHWRDARQATNWRSLQTRVRQWQATALLGWTEDDIVAVAQFLNDSIYHFTPAAEPKGVRPAAAPGHRPGPIALRLPSGLSIGLEQELAAR